jgi:phosphoribosylformylglycinamidine synthase
MIPALIITTAGINCDRELAMAFKRAGAAPQSIHLNALRRTPALVDRFALIGLPGGFSYGDAIAAGRIEAQMLRSVYPALTAAVQRGVPIIAPCNGFQVAVQLGLLPGPDTGAPWPTAPAEPVVALATNVTARFIDRWTRIEIPANSRCVWTHDLTMSDDTGLMPIAHGEGRFVVDSPERLEQLDANGQVAMRYAADDNPNGSTGNVAGICDSTGLVFGLMPHPERYTRWTNHPFWTRIPRERRTGDPLGLQLFRNAVHHAESVEVGV